MIFKCVNVPRRNTGKGCLFPVICHHMMFRKEGFKTVVVHSIGDGGPEVTRDFEEMEIKAQKEHKKNEVVRFITKIPKIIPFPQHSPVCILLKSVDTFIDVLSSVMRK